MLVLTPRDETLSRTPGRTLNDFLKRHAIVRPFVLFRSR